MRTSMADRLKARCEQLGMNAGQVAELAGINRSFVYDIMRGRSGHPNLERLERVAKVLKVERRWLMHGLGNVEGEAPILENAEEAFVAISSVGVTASMGGGALVTDADRLRRILENLVDNAVKYTQPGGHVEIRTLPLPDGGVRIDVRDDGPGIASEHLPRLFERFYRADRARASRGTGLGLAIVKHIVTSAGGTIEARGGPGEGLEIRCFFSR